MRVKRPHMLNLLPVGGTLIIDDIRYHIRGAVDYAMKTYQFDIVVKDVSEITDQQADDLFAAGCDDGTPACCNGRAWIHFDREASSLEDAIRSAVSQVQAAGFKVSKIELEGNTAVTLDT